MSASWYVPTGSIFSRRVPSNKSGDCGTIEIALRTADGEEGQHPQDDIANILKLTVTEANVRNVHSIDLDPALSSLEDTEQREQE
jgi:hypothetical protein